MKFKIIMEIDTDLYEKEFGVRITEPEKMLEQLVGSMVPPGTKSFTARIEK